MRHVAQLFSGDETIWESAPKYFRDAYADALVVMRRDFPNASIRLELAP